MRKKKTVKRVVVIIIVVCFLIAVGRYAYIREDERLYRAVRSHVQEHGASEVTLGELMPFEWDQAVFFHHGASPVRIYEVSGLTFGQVAFVEIGVIFAIDGEIVYYEFFPLRSQGIDLFAYRFVMGNLGTSVRVFSRDDIFRVGRNERLHWISPQEQK